MFLRRWLDENPGAQPIRLAYAGLVDPCELGISYVPAPVWRQYGSEGSGSGPKPGYYAISVNLLRGMSFMLPDAVGRRALSRHSDYENFLPLKPIATAGFSIYIFLVDLRTANLWRQQLGFEVLRSDYQAAVP